MTEGGWYWWAGAIAAATLALINLSVYLRTERETTLAALLPPIPAHQQRPQQGSRLAAGHPQGHRP
jgi:hypothetical protein